MNVAANMAKKGAFQIRRFNNLAILTQIRYATMNEPKGKAEYRLANIPPIKHHCQAESTRSCSAQATINNRMRSAVPFNSGIVLTIVLWIIAKIPKRIKPTKLAILV